MSNKALHHHQWCQMCRSETVSFPLAFWDHCGNGVGVQVAVASAAVWYVRNSSGWSRECCVVCSMCRCSSDFVQIQLLLKKFSNSTRVIRSGLVSPLANADDFNISNHWIGYSRIKHKVSHDYQYLNQGQFLNITGRILWKYIGKQFFNKNLLEKVIFHLEFWL